MRFAFLGADEDSLELLEAIQRQRQHSVVACYNGDPAFEKIVRQLAPEVQWSSDWEALLHEPVAEVVVVSCWRNRIEAQNQLRADQLRKLVQAAVPLVVIQPGCEAIVGFEVDMIRRDTGSAVIPYYPRASWLPIDSIWPATAARPIQQILCERRVAEWLPDELRVQLARDVYMLGHLLGKVQRVNAFGTALRGGPPRLTVHLESQSAAAAQWSLITTSGAPLLRVVVNSGSTSITATSEQTGEWRIDADNDVRVLSLEDPAETLIRDLPALLQNPSDPDWSVACRAQEVTELAERSVDRGRTLELYHEEHSEQETFKGVMAVGSCALLMLTLMVLIIGSIVEGIRLPYARDDRDAASTGANEGADGQAEKSVRPAPRQPARPLWLRLWPVYPLLIFLLLQSLRLAFPAAPRQDEPPQPAKADQPESDQQV